MLALDHFIYAGHDIESLSTEYSSKLNFKAVYGGQHEKWGTYNYLAYFSNNAYIEWLGIENEHLASQSDLPLIKHLIHQLNNKQYGLFQFALRTDDLNAYISHFDKNKIPYTGPYNGKRTLSNGKIITWRMLFPTYDYTKETLPFLIEWDQAENERVNVSLINANALTKIIFSGTSLENFLFIYNLPFKKRIRQSVRLKNTTLAFRETGKLDLTIN